MKNNDVPEFKPLGTTTNPYEQYLKKIVRIQTRGDSRSISGEVIGISDRHLTLEHLDSRTTLVRLSEIAVITETPRRVV
jgi:hypothetical protein